MPDGLGERSPRLHMTVEPYLAVAMQLTARSVDGAGSPAAARRAILDHVSEVERQIRGARAFLEVFTGTPLKLVVLPEYLFTSFESGAIADFRARAVFAPEGPEYAAIGAVARRLGIFLAGNAYESDPAFPGIHFQCCFIFAPTGARILTYRRLNSMYAATPHDIWSKFLAVHGEDAVFPVVDTEIGRLAAIASEEILYPEIARAHALKGAELLVHCSSEIGSPLATPKHIARRARALENLAYVVSANTAGIAGKALPLASADGNSAIIDWKGNVVSESNPGETFTAFAEIDIGAVRRHRRKPGMSNYLARQRLELFRHVYAGTVQPADSLVGKDGAILEPGRAHFEAVARATILKREEQGLI
jgi:predicted amidohydrolase